MSVLFFDTETSGLPDWKSPSDASHQPRIVSVAAMLHDNNRQLIGRIDSLVKPDGWVIGEDTVKIHGITNERATAEGRPFEGILTELLDMIAKADEIVGHNISFDMRMLRIETKRRGIETPEYKTFCTMKKSTDLVNLQPTGKMVEAGFMWPKNPKLAEAYSVLFNEELQGAHNATADMEACARIYYHLKDQGA